MKQIYQYYKVRKEKQENFGIKYFRVSSDSETVMQVCISPATEYRRGRSNNIGVYLITRQTFVYNYFGMSYVEPTTRADFVKRFKQLIDVLTPAEVKESRKKPKMKRRK